MNEDFDDLAFTIGFHVTRVGRGRLRDLLGRDCTKSDAARAAIGKRVADELRRRYEMKRRPGAPAHSIGPEPRKD